MVRQGVAIDSLPKTPFILGSECAGEIEQVGEGVDKFKVGVKLDDKYLMYYKALGKSVRKRKVWSEVIQVPKD